MDNKREMGFDNHLPLHQSEDLAHIDIIKQGVGGVGGVVVVMAGEGEGVRMPCRHTGRNLYPSAAVVARLRQDSRSRAARVVFQRCRGPVIGHGVGADDLVPEGEGACARGCREGLGDGAIAVGGRGGTSLTSIGARMRGGADGGRRAARGPTREAARLEDWVDHGICDTTTT